MKVRWRGCDVYGRKTFSECLLRNSNTKLGRLRKFGLRLVCCVRKLTWIESYITPEKVKSLPWLQRNYFKSTSKINVSPRKLIPMTEKRACLDCHKLSPLPTNQIPEQNCIYNLYYLALCDGVRISLVLWYVHNGLLKPIKEAQRIKTSTVTVSSKNWFSFHMWIVLLKIHNVTNQQSYITYHAIQEMFMFLPTRALSITFASKKVVNFYVMYNFIT